ncbi:Hint domain-containing protein [Maritimibacter sp. UBA3975]|uniref:Hint domain-containing protein n=1 Tax=Maritimibacter sp. UBA3975 TaxID=1946833 RepID=UPI000C0B1DAE|nr:Hint domain-containing protein [Maritimibacter sp. UBA3975]MAM61672.1 type I secretion protein [Maritimibacter sp.]
MATMNSGLGGPAGYGEGVYSSSPKAAGNVDDGSVYVDTSSVFSGGIDFFGTTYGGLYVNSNGNISFGQPNTDYQTGNLANETIPTIAPFWGDVNVNAGGEIYWDLDPASGTITITWDNVARYSGSGNNSFQVVLTDRGDGNFTAEFIYEDIQWTTGYSQVAQAGITDGAGNDFILPGSGSGATMAGYETYDFGTDDPNGTTDFFFAGGTPVFGDGVIEGTSGDDTIDADYYGDPDGDLVDDGDGTGPNGDEDLIFALGGDDTVYAGDGNDTVYGGAGADNIFGEDGDDTIWGDNGGTAATTEDLNWNLAGGDGTSIASGFTQNTGTMDVSVSFTTLGNNALFEVATSETNYVAPGEGFAPNSSAYIYGNGDAATGRLTVDFAPATGSGMTDEVENVSFRLNDVDSFAGNHIDVLSVTAYDADGNPVPVVLTAAGNDTVSGNTVTAGGTLDNPQDAQGSVLVEIPGPVASFEVVYSNSLSGTHGINVTDVSFDTIPEAGGNDNIFGGAGDDTIYGEDGDDTITGGTGADTLFGGAGDDVFYLGANDSATGGDGDDIFYLDPGTALGGPGATITIIGSETDEDGGGDTLDFAGLVDWGEISYTDAESGSVALADGTTVTFSNIENVIICFAHGTGIDTPRGRRPIQDLRPGDLVLTRDDGPQPVRWIGRRTVPGTANFAPVRFARGAFGNDTPLYVSPQHRMLYTGGRANLYFDSPEVIVPAKHLAGLDDIRQVEVPWITYYHLLFDTHQVVMANGAASESFHPGGVGLGAIDPAAREELFTLFPALRTDANTYGRTARRVLRQFEARILAA